MKKIAYMIVLLALTVSCKEEKTVTTDTAVQAKEKDTVDAVDARTGIGECGDIIVIKESALGDVSRWRQVNNKYILSGTTPTNPDTDPDPSKPACPDPKILVDLRKFEYNNLLLAYWLKVNSHAICFEETSRLIECEHRITNEHDRTTAANVTEVISIAVSDFENKLAASGIRIDSYHYNQYINIGISGTNLTTTALSDYENDKHCMSVPQYLSIRKRHSLTSGSILKFRPVPKDDKVEIVMSYTRPSDSKVYYYNFSQIPNATEPRRGNTPL